MVSFVLPSTLVACKAGQEEGGPDLRPQSMQASDKLRAVAQELGRAAEATAGKPSKEAIWSYLDVIARTATLFGGPLLVSDTSAQPKVTPIVVAGLELTIVEVAKSLSGGLKYPDPTTQHAFEAFDVRSEKKRLGRLGRADLEATFRDNIRILMLLSLLTDENLSRQLVPPGSQKATELTQKSFFSEAGRLLVPAPPVDDIDIGPWGTFSEILTRGPTVFSSIRYEATLRGGFPE
jgi:hypothetical protein